MATLRVTKPGNRNLPRWLRQQRAFGGRWLRLATLCGLASVLVIIAQDANRRNFIALARLSGDFLDRIRVREPLRLFHRADAETAAIAASNHDFRQRTMEVLRLAFLSSAVQEFFASLAIAVVAVYFGFTYLGELHFGRWGQSVTLFAGFVALLLAPEFFQLPRDLGAFYHAKAQTVGGAEAIERFLRDSPAPEEPAGSAKLDADAAQTVVAENLVALSADKKILCGPLSFTLPAGKRVALVGKSGAGKTVLMNVLLGFLPCEGSLRVNGVELRELSRTHWHQQIAWLSQNPQLPAETLCENIVMGGAQHDSALDALLAECGVSEFLPRLAEGLASRVGDAGAGLSVGQAQLIALARALDKASRQQTTLMITHQLDQLAQWDVIWVMQEG
ncbi:thiol reductant ABC exporter subunit CydD|nr:thiol reductant ABC exporter subunit CydD [Candidatus Pantoea persica]